MRTLNFVIALAALCALPNGVLAQGVGSSMDVEEIEAKMYPDYYRAKWTVKFVCGTVRPKVANPQKPKQKGAPLVPGTYRTSINIVYLPGSDKSTQFHWNVILTQPPGDPWGPPEPGSTKHVASPFWLNQYQGAEITCKEIRSPLEEQPLLLVTGFLEFDSAGTALDGSMS